VGPCGEWAIQQREQGHPRDALRFWKQNEALVQQMKLDALREQLAKGEAQAKRGALTTQTVKDLLKELKR
jgi:hypothetical protein